MMNGFWAVFRKEITQMLRDRTTLMFSTAYPDPVEQGFYYADVPVKRALAWLFDSVLIAFVVAIVGFELPVARIEGKWKLSQNRTELDRAGAAQGLQTSDDPHAQQVGRLVADRART